MYSRVVMKRPLSVSCSMRSRSTTVEMVALVVVSSDVTSPAMVTDVAVDPAFSVMSMDAVWPVRRLNSPFQVSVPGDSTEIR